MPTQKFRKKPVVIEAEQYFLGKNVPGVCNCGIVQRQAHIHTLEGSMTVSPGDWVITGVQGEKYPCKPDIFAATYERVQEGPMDPTGYGPNHPEWVRPARDK